MCMNRGVRDKKNGYAAVCNACADNNIAGVVQSDKCRKQTDYAPKMPHDEGSVKWESAQNAYRNGAKIEACVRVCVCKMSSSMCSLPVYVSVCGVISFLLPALRQ